MLNSFCFGLLPILGSANRVFNLHVIRSCASFFTRFSFVYFLITSLHLSFGLPIFWCPPTSTFSALGLIHHLQSFSSHGLMSVPLIASSRRCRHLDARVRGRDPQQGKHAAGVEERLTTGLQVQEHVRHCPCLYEGADHPRVETPAVYL